MASNLNQKIKNNQRYLWTLIMVAIGSTAGGVYFLNKHLKDKKPETVQFEEETTTIEPDLTGAITNTFDGKVGSQVLTDAQAESKENRDALRKVLEELEEIKGQLNQSKEENEALKNQVKDQNVVMQDVISRLGEVQRGENMPTYTEQPAGGNTATRSKTNVRNNNQGSNYVQNGGVVKLSDVPSEKKTFERKSYVKRGNANDSRFYIPSGAFSNAIILEGADANASVTAQTTNVAPMMFKLTGDLHLPANNRSSKLKGCFVTAGTYGDISSERAIVRLERLSCVINGKHIDQAVQGHVAFYGKNGIKGTPVMRNGKMLGLAFASGAMGGLGSAVSQVGTTTVGIGATSETGVGDVARSALGGGASTAANKMADYYIQRAEQYHPVIPIGSANRVEVVFQNGFWAEFIEDVERAEQARQNKQPQQDTQAEATNNIPQGIPDELQRQLGEVKNQSLADFVTPNQK